ncbi:tyrosine-type recombinase/integrase [Brevibacillus formosus]|nr:tyrosine-type recombinase/integrase [Brevibacillus formosus]MED2000042.1 tyrosine-type recombinase/integrase [Brevibacillus formosus]MED2081821.1 tyrosine-type recombinase/integrase [Brevibacillus formosus]
MNLVLPRDDGNFVPKSSLFNAFSRTLKRLNIPSIPIHSLRHTHAVLLLETGTDMKYIQERLGHGSIQITSDVYAHISKKIELDNMDKFESYMESVYSEKTVGKSWAKMLNLLKNQICPPNRKNPSHLQAQGVSLINKQSCIARAPNRERVF